MFIYLHGFNSSGQSAKGQFFADEFGESNVIRPSYSMDPDLAIASLSELISTLMANSFTASPILIGSSLGGYYAQYLAQQFKLASILINPALRPIDTLAPYVGKQTHYYTQQEYEFTATHLAALAKYHVPSPCSTGLPCLVLLDEADELIDYRIAEQTYQACAQIHIYPGGHHQFAHLTEAATQITHFCEQFM